MKKLFVLLFVLFVAGIALFLTLKKSTKLSIEDKFGTFCLSCSAIESGSAVGVYGFGLAYCDDKIRNMTKNVDFKEIEDFKLYLRKEELVQVLDKVLLIEYSLKKGNNEEYFSAVQDYSKEIALLDTFDKQKVLKYLKR